MGGLRRTSSLKKGSYYRLPKTKLKLAKAKQKGRGFEMLKNIKLQCLFMCGNLFGPGTPLEFCVGSELYRPKWHGVPFTEPPNTECSDRVVVLAVISSVTIALSLMGSIFRCDNICMFRRWVLGFVLVESESLATLDIFLVRV